MFEIHMPSGSIIDIYFWFFVIGMLRKNQYNIVQFFETGKAKGVKNLPEKTGSWYYIADMQLRTPRRSCHDRARLRTCACNSGEKRNGKDAHQKRRTVAHSDAHRLCHDMGQRFCCAKYRCGICRSLHISCAEELGRCHFSSAGHYGQGQDHNYAGRYL